MAALLLAAACARAGTGGVSGIEGRVLLGPQCPVVTEASPCPDEPVATELVVTGEDGDRVATVRSGPDGRFRVLLPPGDYVVRPQVPAAARFAKPVEVTVVPGEVARVDVFLDTGIRGPEGQPPDSS